MSLFKRYRRSRRRGSPKSGTSERSTRRSRPVGVLRPGLSKRRHERPLRFRFAGFGVRPQGFRRKLKGPRKMRVAAVNRVLRNVLEHSVDDILQDIPKIELFKKEDWRPPAKLNVCSQRDDRRRALFALRVAGYGLKRSPGKGGSYKRKVESTQSCGR